MLVIGGLIGGGAHAFYASIFARPTIGSTLAGLFVYQEDISRFDLASMTLTVATIVLGAVAVFLGVFAVYTITSIKEDLDARIAVRVGPAVAGEIGRAMGKVQKDYLEMLGPAMNVKVPAELDVDQQEEDR